MSSHNIKTSFNDTLLTELIKCSKAWRSWCLLGYYEIKLAYRRTMLGPFWTTLSLAITIGMLSLFWAYIFNRDIATFTPYVLAGFISWGWISRTLTSSGDVFLSARMREISKDNKIPLFFIFCHSIVSFITFLHQLIIVFFLYLITPVKPSFDAIYLFPLALLLYFINSIFISAVIAITVVRYRDIKQLIASILPPLMLLTPVIWLPSMLGAHEWLATLNPFTHFIAIMRDPLIGNPIDWRNWIVVSGMTVVNFLLFTVIYNHYRKRFVFWL